MAINPRLVFQAPQIAGPQGLGGRGPAAAARATGGRVPVITTDQGVTAPAPAGSDVGIASLTRDMQQEIGALKGPEDLPKLNWKMAQTGEQIGRLFRGEDTISGGEGTEVLVGGGEDKTTISDDGTPIAADAQMAQYEADLLKAAQVPALTTEAANKQAKNILGIDETEDVPDWAMPLFAFGMALMAEPGSFGQAVGKAGLKTLPVIAQVKKEKKAERRQTGKIAYDLMTANAATRSKAVDRSMNYLWKKKTFNQAERKFKADQKQALFDGIYKWVGILPDRAKAAASGKVAALISGQFMNGVDLSSASLNDMEKATGAFIAKTTSEMHKTNPLAWAEMQGFNVIGEGDWALQKLMGADGREATYRVNKVAGMQAVYGKDGQPIYNDDGTPKLKFYNAFELKERLDQGRVVSGGPSDAGWQLALFGGDNNKLYQRLVNTNDYTTPKIYKAVDGTVYPAGSVVPAGKYVRDTGDTGRTRAQVGTLYMVGKGGKVESIATGDAEAIKSGMMAGYRLSELKEYKDATLGVVASSRLAQSIIDLADANPRATALTGGATGFVIRQAQKFSIWLDAFTGQEFKAFEGAVGSLGIFKNVDVSAGGKVANNASSLFGLSDKMNLDYVNSIRKTKFGSAREGSTERELTDDEFNALQGLASLDIGMRARLWKMAYAVARVSEPGGRLTDRDFANALAQMGVDANGNFDPVSLKATLRDLAAEAQAGIVDQANWHSEKGGIKASEIFGKDGRFSNTPLFKGGNLIKLIKPEVGQPSGDQSSTSKVRELFPLLTNKTAMVNGVSTPLFTSEGGVNSEAVAERLRTAQRALQGGQTLGEDVRAALSAEVERLGALSDMILKN